ncbi:MAG: hypothetical protein R6V12_03120 [Candidatus Hydrogenedentota bacterium]
MPDGGFDGSSAADAVMADKRGGLRWLVLIGCLAAGMAAGGLFYTRATRFLYTVLVGPPLLLANFTGVGRLVAPNHAGLAIVTALMAAV